MKKLKIKLDYRLTALHLIATCFMIGAFKNFSTFPNIEFLSIYKTFGYNGLESYSISHHVTMSEMLSGLFLKVYGTLLLGLVVGFILSMYICVRKRKKIVSSFIILVIGWIMIRFNIDKIFILPNTNPISPVICLTGSFFFASISLVTFFSKKVNSVVQPTLTANDG